MKRLFLVSLLSLSCMLFAESSFATHVVGAEITYEWVSGNRFRFKLLLFRDCGSNIFIQPRQKLFYNSFTCAPTQDSIQMTQVGQPQDVSMLCGRIPSTCNGGTNPGVHKFTFVGEKEIAQGCRDWVIYFRDCNRSSNVNAIVEPSNQCLYVEARLNNLDAPRNSSPAFTVDPMSFLCVGQEVSMSGGVQERDGDRMVFRLVSPRTNLVIPNQPNLNTVTYINGLSPSNPIPTENGFNFDSTTGTVVCRPISTIQSVWALQVNEFRNGVFIGSVIRDFQLLVRDCSNNLPFISGVNLGAEYERTICLGDSASFLFEATDTDDSVSLVWNNGITSANFSGDTGYKKATGHFGWKPQVSDLGDHFFTLTATDNHCPEVGLTSVTIKIKVRRRPIVALPADTNISCGITVPVSARVVSGEAPFVFSWSNSASASQTANFGHGIIVVRLADATGCFATDTMALLGSGLSAGISTDTNCVNRVTRFSPNVMATDNNLLLNYSWDIQRSSGSGQIRRATLEKPEFIFDSAGMYLANLRITASNNCTLQVSQNVQICSRPVNSATFRINVCEDEAQNIGCGVPNTGGFCGISRISFQHFNSNYFTFTGNGRVILHPDSLGPDTNIFNVTTYSPSGCSNSVNYRFNVVGKPKAIFNPSQIDFNCLLPDTFVRVKVFKSPWFVSERLAATITYGDSIYNLPLSLADTLRYSVPVKYLGNILVRSRMTGGCTNLNAASINSPISGNISSNVFCNAGDTTHLIADTQVRFGTKEVKWNIPGEGITYDLNPSRVFPPGQFITVRLMIEDSTTCKDTLTHTINTLLPDTNVVVSSDTVCNRGYLTFQYPNQSLLTRMVWNTNDTTITYTIPFLGDSLTFSRPGSNALFVAINYKQSCQKTWKAGDLWIRNPVRTTLSLQNTCAYDSTRFVATKLEGDFSVKQFMWTHRFVNQPVPAISDTGTYVSRLFNRNGRLRTTLKLIDSKNCSASSMLDTNMILMSKPAFDVSGSCQKDSLIFFTGRVPDLYENTDRYIYNYGDNGFEASANGQGLHQFGQPGNYMVILTSFSREGCSNIDSTLLTIKPRPKALINPSPETACQNYIFNVDGLGSLPAQEGERITSYFWAQNNIGISTEPSVGLQFLQPGLQHYSLQVKSENGCQDYLKIPVLIHPTPKAGFEANPFDMIEKSHVQFLDQSAGATFWRWTFGDGNSFTTSNSFESSPKHKFTNGEMYQVNLWVKNEFGCADSTSKNVNMKAYLAVPNAFTPNNDARNDSFKPLHRLVKELVEFRIFNRLGEEVFVENSSLDKGWDGTFKGKLQPSGVYVYVIKAKSVYDEDLVLKGKLSLLH